MPRQARLDIPGLVHHVMVRGILGASRSRSVASARRQFFRRSVEEAGATLSMLGRLTGRSHVTVKLALKAGRGVGDE